MQAAMALSSPGGDGFSHREKTIADSPVNIACVYGGIVQISLVAGKKFALCMACLNASVRLNLARHFTTLGIQVVPFSHTMNAVS